MAGNQAKHFGFLVPMINGTQPALGRTARKQPAEGKLLDSFKFLD